MPSLEKASSSASASASSKKAQVDNNSSRKRKLTDDISITLTKTSTDFPRGKSSSSTTPVVAINTNNSNSHNKSTTSDDKKPSKQRKLSLSKKQQQQKSLANSKKDKEKDSALDVSRIEHLNYKRLTPGSLLSVEVITVKPFELTVSLPGQLLGHIPITNISSTLTDRIEAAAAAEDEEDDDDNDDDSSDDQENDNEEKQDDTPNLQSMFKPGQLLSASVLNVKTLAELKQTREGIKRLHDEDTRTSHRVELALDPKIVNAKLQKKDISVGMTITGSIKSAEDHGYIIDLGLGDCDGFAKFTSSNKNLEIGNIAWCKVDSISKNNKTFNVSLQDLPANTSLDNLPSVDSILPNTPVNAIITAVSQHGLNVKFCGIFDATIDIYHLDKPYSAYTVGNKVLAKVLWILPEQIAAPRVHSLSLLPHLLNPNQKLLQSRRNDYPHGLILPQVQITKVEPEWGVFCLLENGQRAFTHISRISDDRIDHLQTSSGPYIAGTNHVARVVGYSPIDDLVQLSMQPSVLNTQFYQASDLQVGQPLEVQIKDLTSNGLFVKVSDTLDGVIWPIHYSDATLRRPSMKFRTDKMIKARVLSIDTEKNRVVLTARKSFLTSDLVIPSSKDQIHAGMIFEAVVTKILQKALLLDTYNGIRVLVPIGEASDRFIDNLNDSFHIGSNARVKVIHIDPKTNNITASIKRVLSSTNSDDDDNDDDNDNNKEKSKSEKKKKQQQKEPEYDSSKLQELKIGSNISGKITAIHPENAVLKIDGFDAKALISLRVLARNQDTTIEQLHKSLKPGQNLENLVVVNRNLDKGFVIVGLHHVQDKQNDVTSSSSSPEKQQQQQPKYISQAISASNLEIGQTLPIKISANKNQFGVRIKVNQHINGQIPLYELSDDYDKLPKKGKKVDAKIIKIHSDKNTVDLSLRKSRFDNKNNDNGDKVKDALITSTDQVKKGQSIRGFVSNITDAGVFVTLGSDVSARVQIKELFDSFVKNWKPHFKKGQLVSGRIIDVSSEGRIEMSLKTSTTNDESSKLTFADLEQDSIIQGIVKRIDKYGIFIRIEGSQISGLCHKSEITDDDDDGQENWQNLYKQGQKVRALIIKVDRDNQRVSFSLKPSKVPEIDQNDQGMLVDGHDSDEDDSDLDSDAQMSLDENDDIDSDDDQVDFDEDEDEDDDEDEDEEEFDNDKKRSLKAGGKINWEGEDDDVEMDQESDEDDDLLVDESEEDEADTNKTSLTKSSKKPDQSPETPEEFEQKLKKKPNVGATWIAYMTYHLRLYEVSKAREIAQRAIETINFRQEDEKMKVWLALLSLENSYGTSDSLEKTFNDAVQRNEPKHLQLKFIHELERAGNIERATEIVVRLIKKHGQSCKVWVQSAQFYLRQGQTEKARDLLPQALQRLPSRKHLKVTFRFALTEYSLGDPERGRTLFEGILDSYPKRLDLWRVYIDKEVQQGNIQVVRTLFDRVLQQHLSTMKTKNLFKKWLAIEKDHGDAKGVESVKSRAVEYVEKMTQKE